MAKDRQGNILPWNPSGYSFEDGSIEGDLPMRRLSELFSVNHFLVAQVNPHMLPFMNTRPGPSSRFSKAVVSLSVDVMSEFAHRCSQAIQAGFGFPLLQKTHSILRQKYTGNITIIPAFSWSEYANILSNPSVELTTRYMILGEKTTYPSSMQLI